MASPRPAPARAAASLRLAALVLCGALLAACSRETPAPPEPSAGYQPSDFAALPGWRDDDLLAALPALERSCGRLAGLDGDAAVGPAALRLRAADWRPLCQSLRGFHGDGATLREVLEWHLQPVAVTDQGGDPEGTFTGYYESELSGAEKPGPGYRVPLLGPPPGLALDTIGGGWFSGPAQQVWRFDAGREREPVPDRAAIETGALKGYAKPILWLADPVEAHILHIQGSGRVRLPDGRVVQVGYAGSNGKAFTGIARVLLDEGLITPGQASMQQVRAWLKAHPEQARTLMRRNARYIFFKRIEGPGPIGAEGVALTPGRSLAVDTRFVPLGAPLWLDTRWPAGDRPLRRLVVAQDVGSAIKGQVRGDFFFGAGEQAFQLAGRMKRDGRYWLLLPRRALARRVAAAVGGD
ncbi:membrane-bound lytic murein transglycosylase A [Tistlia consotensis]|uniref:peptidoglycan lytic exotransglycosylase n=1 Tax=Tistlia consotensis USBA 355 TaxID=560819 RepID=A0A1Y6BFU7_9PROT|nr:MltA domain-containing protein [Tistlia consotensis]SMF08907.1 membrane-bound lytic murein transglycosylase A [Tistlia consotensis USBA 355]SNR35029.1 membrane-bound lytic murein transglycosylase A [Tistlia consotensis]